MPDAPYTLECGEPETGDDGTIWLVVTITETATGAQSTDTITLEANGALRDLVAGEAPLTLLGMWDVQ